MTLRNVIDKDRFFIENVSYSDKDLKAMSADELETLKMKITKKIKGLSLAMENNPTNDPYSKDLINRQKRARYFNENVLVYVNLLIKSQRSQKKTMTDYFFEHARDILPIALFNQILDEAQKSVKRGVKYAV